MKLNRRLLFAGIASIFIPSKHKTTEPSEITYLKRKIDEYQHRFSDKDKRFIVAFDKGFIKVAK